MRCRTFDKIHYTDCSHNWKYSATFSAYSSNIPEFTMANPDNAFSSPNFRALDNLHPPLSDHSSITRINWFAPRPTRPQQRFGTTTTVRRPQPAEAVAALHSPASDERWVLWSRCRCCCCWWAPWRRCAAGSSIIWHPDTGWRFAWISSAAADSCSPGDSLRSGRSRRPSTEESTEHTHTYYSLRMHWL